MIFPPIYIIPVPRANKSTATCKYIYYIPSKLFSTIEKIYLYRILDSNSTV